MMNAKDYFKFKELPSLNATAIQLPYKNSDIAMLFILPKTRTGLAVLESSLKAVEFEEILKDMTEIKITIKLPKFKIETEIGLNNILETVSRTFSFKGVSF